MEKDNINIAEVGESVWSSTDEKISEHMTEPETSETADENINEVRLNSKYNSLS